MMTEHELMLNMNEPVHHLSHPLGHTLLIYQYEDELSKYLHPLIESIIAHKGECILFMSSIKSLGIYNELARHQVSMPGGGGISIFPPEEFSVPLFHKMLYENSSRENREIFVVREIPSHYRLKDLMKEEREIDRFLNTMPARFICVVNENCLDARSKLFSLSTHPWVVIQGVLCENFYYNATGHSHDIESLFHQRLDTLQLQGLLRREMVGRDEASSKEMQIRIQELSLLNSLSQAVTRSFEINSLVKEAFLVILSFLQMDAAEIYFPIIRKEWGRLCWATNDASFEALNIFDSSLALVNKTLKSWTPMWSSDMDCTNLGIDIPEPFNNFSFLFVPIALRDGTKGVLKFIGLSPVELSAEKVELIRAAGSQITLGIEKLQLYHELLSAKREWEGTFNSLSDLIFIRDNRFRTLRYNQALASAFTLQGEDAVGQECYRLIFDRSTPCPQCRAFKEKREWDTKEKKNNGEERIWRHQLFPLRNDEGKVTGAIHVLSDITEEEHLRQQLYHADKMTALGQMISGVAHEVNNPLTGILGFLDIVKDQSLSESQSELVEKIHYEAQRAASVMRSLLTFARDYKPTREAVNMEKILRECIDIKAHDFQMKNIKVIKEFTSVPETIADPNQFRQVFMNLITNAEQAIMEHKGGGTILVGASYNKGFLEIHISDDGPGIPDEKKNKIFEPFFTTKEPGKGTGLGLAISHSILAEHNGTVEVTDSVLGGAAFLIKIPHVPPPRKSAEPASSQPLKASAAGRKARVAVVDDEPSLRRIIEVSLKKEGHEVMTLASAFDALRVLSEERFDLVILDMKMPGMGGIELCRRLSKPLPPLLVMSGDTVSEEIKAFAEEAGAMFLAKPFTVLELNEAVRLMLTKSD
jgi:signal transduction histidine kinase/CheY-like chemotaxis protein